MHDSYLFQIFSLLISYLFHTFVILWASRGPLVPGGGPGQGPRGAHTGSQARLRAPRALWKPKVCKKYEIITI